MTDLLLPGAPASAAEAAPRPMMVVDDAHVTYRVFASGKRMSARDSLFSMNALRGGRGLQTVPALRGVSFTASEGETIGVIGHNGSGKSTLFRAMSGLIPTSEGTIWAADRPVLLGVNAALVPELSGENNIKLGLLAMGFTADEAAAHVDEIADFAELNEFLYHPMRTYSSGMGARLKFAIASAKAHSVLLIDEALSVGDRRFKLKSEQRIRELRDNAGLVMIVSHSVGSLRDTCDRVLWIHKGELREDGPTNDVIADYVKWTKQPGNTAVGAASKAKAARPAATGRAAVPVPAATGRAAVPVAAAAGLAASTAMPAVAAPTTGGARGPEPVPRSEPSPFEQLLLGAAVEAKAVVSPPESLQANRRRERHRQSSRERTRRNVIVMAVTGVAMLLAIGTGAAVALVNNVPSTPSTVDSPIVEGSVPVIESFTASQATVECATAEGEADVLLSWKVDNASWIAIAAGAAEVDAIDEPLKSGLPAEAVDHVVSFSCADESVTYTLTAANPDGDRTSSVVKVSRTLAPIPTEEPVIPDQPTTRQQPVAPVAPVAPVDTTPVDPAPVDPVIPDPLPSEPVTPDPGPSEPVTPDPGPSEPVTPDPAPSEPTTDPAPSEPAAP